MSGAGIHGKSRFEQVAKLVADELDVPLKQIKPESSWASLGADSLEVAQLIIRMEEEFQIDVPYDDKWKFLTVQDAVNYLEMQFS